MATAKQLPSGNWHVQVYAGKDENGKRIYMPFTESTERKANLAALEWQEHYKEISRDTANMTVDEAITAYIKLKSNILSPSTIRGYEIIQRNRLKSIINTKIGKLTKNSIQEEFNLEAKNLSPKSVSNTYGLLTAILGQYRPGWVIPKITLPQKEKPDEKALDSKDIAILLNSIDGNFIEIPVLLALWFGMRRSEIIGLKWSDIDFKHNTITVRHAIVPGKKSKPTEKGPKTKESKRVNTLSPYIKAKLEALDRTDDYVVHMYMDTPTKSFKKICKRAGLDDFKFHDLRRSMATAGITLNVADKLIMARGGWSNPQTMKKIYQVVLQSDMQQANEQINSYFESLLPENVQHEMQHDIEKSE